MSWGAVVSIETPAAALFTPLSIGLAFSGRAFFFAWRRLRSLFTS